MNNVLNLYSDLNALGVKFYHWNMDGDKAVTLEINGQYGVFMDFCNIETSAEELVVLAHEGGHICTGATHKVCSPFDLVEKHEHKANKWAIQKLIPEDELNSAVSEGCTNIFTLAEHFEVTEDFMKLAVCWYTYGDFDVNSHLW